MSAIPIPQQEDEVDEILRRTGARQGPRSARMESNKRGQQIQRPTTRLKIKRF